MKSPSAPAKLSGKIVSFNISPKGAPESFLLGIGNKICQVNLPKGMGENIAAKFQAGKSCSVTAVPVEDERPAAHPVYELAEMPARAGSGVIDRVNYARHGAANGVVLKTGEFLHLKPEGAKNLSLKPGGQIKFEGERREGQGSQIVIDVSSIDGKKIAKKDAHKKHAAKKEAHKKKKKG